MPRSASTKRNPHPETRSTLALEKELRATKAQLQAATDQLEAYIEDMKSTTEEYQAVTEELQSSNEELETAKEELQSINEELQTVNGELQSKNDAMERLNSDLKNLLDSTQIATVFLDDALRIKHYTPGMEALFPLRDVDRGRPITDVVTQLAYDELRTDVQDVQRTLRVVERELDLKGGAASFLMRIRPYRTVQDVIDGVVITFTDITANKRAQRTRELFIERAPAPHPQPSCRRAIDFRHHAGQSRLARGLRDRVQRSAADPVARAGTHVTRGWRQHPAQRDRANGACRAWRLALRRAYCRCWATGNATLPGDATACPRAA